MPLKAAIKDADGGLDPFVQFLLHVLASTETEVKGAEHYHLFGLHGPKNLVRKVNDLATPYGYKLDHGKMVRIGGTVTTTPTATPTGGKGKRTASPAPTTNGDDKGDDSDVESPTKRAKSTKATTKSEGKANKTGSRVNKEAGARDKSEISE